ncbi:B-box zinc finger protein 21, partial [Linum grandiflorum]
LLKNPHHFRPISPIISHLSFLRLHSFLPHPWPDGHHHPHLLFSLLLLLAYLFSLFLSSQLLALLRPMKIQCDVCEKEEAAVYCTADEAALCDTCDHRVHHANKLASKHFRFSLLLPDPKSFPLCDVCQEKRAFVFCQQDRAILCQDCDVPIHTANEFTHHHNRFLLTGVKLSPTSQIYISPSDAATNLVPCITATKSTLKKPLSLSVDVANPNTHGVQAASVKNSTAINNSNNRVGDNNNNGTSMLMTGVGGGYGSVHSSSISEYLIDMLPGWHVDDFLQPPPPSSTPFGFSEV